MHELKGKGKTAHMKPTRRTGRRAWRRNAQGCKALAGVLVAVASPAMGYDYEDCRGAGPGWNECRVLRDGAEAGVSWNGRGVDLGCSGQVSWYWITGAYDSPALHLRAGAAAIELVSNTEDGSGPYFRTGEDAARWIEGGWGHPIVIVNDAGEEVGAASWPTSPSAREEFGVHCRGEPP